MHTKPLRGITAIDYRDPTDNAPFRQTFAPPLALKIGNQSYRFRVCQVHFWMLIWGSHVFVVYLKITGLFKAKVPKSAHFCTCSNFLNMHPLLSKHPSYTGQPRPAWFKGVSISVVQGQLKKKSPNQYCETFWGSHATLTLSAESSDNLWKNMA